MTKENIKTFWSWYKVSSTIIGMPVMMILVILGVQKFVFTATCYTAGYGCEYAFGATDGMAMFMQDLVDANPNVDIVAKPKKK